MRHGDQAVPIACTLSAEQSREREATLLAQLRAAVVEAQELPDGYAFRLGGDRKWIALVAELMAEERECCRFLTFRLTAHPNLGPLVLELTGTDGTKDFLRHLLLDPESAAGLSSQTQRGRPK